MQGHTDRITPCVPDQVKILAFFNYFIQFFLYIPAVTEDDDILPAMESRHDLPDHGSCELKLGLVFFPDTVFEGDRLVADLIAIPHRP